VCGICGVVQVGGPPRPVVDPIVLDRMTDMMTHRGPDDRGTYIAEGIGLGVRRLSIVDVEGGHQPVANEDRSIWAIQNGELYNHAHVRRALMEDGHVLTSRCDTEILPHLYESYGPSFPSKLRGMFGLAVWDGRRRRAVVARDRLGIKPLYYARAGDVIVFASELKSVLASGLIDPVLDYDAIDAFLTFGFFPGESTPLAQVRQLRPGHYLATGPDGVSIDRFWHHPAPRVASPRRETADYAEQLIEELEESVRLRLMSDVPLGAMLSGGLDSSLIVALMAKNMSEPVKTFSVGFVEDDRGNELADARYAASVFGTDHHELELSFTEATVDLETLVWHLDEPLAELSALGFHALSELASRHVTVALSGQGADELLAGYRKHRAAAKVARWNRLPKQAQRAGASLALRGPARFRRAAETLAARDHADRLIAMSGQLPAELRARVFRGPLEEVDGGAARRAVLACMAGLDADPLSTTLHIDAQLALSDSLLHYFDRASMAHSLEVRVPFLDHHVVEYCATIPGDLKIHRGETKRLLRLAARGLVPDRIIDKPKIGFFRSAEDAWVRSQISGAFRDYLFAPDARYREFLEGREVEQLVLRHASSAGRGTDRLLIAILMLEVWLSDYLPRALAGSTHAREAVA
jgi:asparagine synthase (glutamine-hydrolysing)